MELRRILPHVYHLHFEECYDLTMHFLRYAEYYEGLKYRGQIPTLVECMEWYAKDYGDGVFTYPADWTGFNVPSSALIEVSEAEIPDLNKYDIQMRSLVETAQQEERGHRFYFIGTCEESDEGTLDHEIGHALYFIDDEYREVMDDLLDAMPRKSYDASWKALQEMRYHPSVCRDEVHAYATIGPCDELKKALPIAVRRPFIKAYKEQRKRWKNLKGK